MKLITLRETLLKPLQMVIGVVERKQTLPILSNVLLTTKGNKITFTGTDLEVELVGQSELEQAPSTDNILTVSGRKLYDICKALPETAPIELYSEKERVILKSGRSRFTLSTLPAADFPNVEEQETSVQFTVSQRALKKLLQHTYFAMAQQDVRYYLNGLLLELGKGRVRAVATDGHRLATSTIDCEIQQDHRMQVIVPRKGVLELLRLLEDSDEIVTVGVSSNHIRVRSEQFIFTSKLIEGRFPDYERVIPQNGDKIIIMERNELKRALGRVAILCNDKFHGVRLEFHKNLLRINANNPEQELAEEELAIDYPGENVEVGFNVNYLQDVLNIIDSESVKLTFSGPDSSMRIEDPKSEQESIFVVMPMRL